MIFAVLFETGRLSHWPAHIILWVVLSFVFSILSFIPTYLKTGLWKFSHKKMENYDERELFLITSSVRIAYAIFTIISLSIILVYAAGEIRMSMVVVFILGLFAHLLPRSVLAWNEKKID